MPKPTTTRSVYIEAAPQDVYDLALGDLESLADWMSSVDSVVSADPHWPEVGSSHLYTRTVGGRTVTGKTTVDEADPPRRVVMREEFSVADELAWPGSAGRSTWTLTPEGTGTRLTMELVGAELSFPVWLLWKLVFSGQARRTLEQSLANLKRICEQELEDAPEG